MAAKYFDEKLSQEAKFKMAAKRVVLNAIRDDCQRLSKNSIMKVEQRSANYRVDSYALISSIYNMLRDDADSATVQGEELVKEYFYASYSYAEIISILFLHHGLKIGLRQLKRVLKSLGLRRRGQIRDAEVIAVMQNEIQGSASSLGYRSMSRRLLTRHGISASRSFVSELQRLIDPEGVSSRRRHQLRRRTYSNKGPNFLIHVDGYDKLKQFGFAIHGAICGFSRRILWLNVANTNNDPEVVAYYFMQYVKGMKGVSRCVRVDAGTENGLIGDIQKAFRWEDVDDMAADNSFLIGSSKSNQRIERWWLNNKQGGCQFWIDAFKDLVARGILSTADPLSIECARFSFMNVLQEDLDTVRMEWNQHQVRNCRQSESTGGKPDILYFMPELYGAVDYRIAVEMDNVDTILNQYCQKPRVCSEEVYEYLTRKVEQMGLRMPSTFEEALQLFGSLLPTVQV